MIIVRCKMPDCCFNCPMYNEEYDKCQVEGRPLNMHMVKSTIAEWCPIIELKPKLIVWPELVDGKER